MATPENQIDYEKIREDHDNLRRVLGEVQQLMEQQVAGPSEAAATLKAFQEHLLEHFTDEEEAGYFEQIEASAPRLYDRTEALRQEHSAMRESMAAILRFCESASAESLWPRLREDFLALQETLAQHEESERELLQEAYDEDIGDKD